MTVGGGQHDMAAQGHFAGSAVGRRPFLNLLFITALSDEAESGAGNKEEDYLLQLSTYLLDISLAIGISSTSKT